MQVSKVAPRVRLAKAFSTTLRSHVRPFRSTTEKSDASTASNQNISDTSVPSTEDISKELSKFARQTASTYAPRPSTAVKNPAVRGSLLYNIFEWQGWLSLAVGGLLSFNIIWPTDEPSIPRLMGMWSMWMFTIPSLRAKECLPCEKDALNLLFLAVVVLNILLPFVTKNFPVIYVADIVLFSAVYYYKGVWKEVYGLPLEPPASGTSSSSETSE